MAFTKVTNKKPNEVYVKGIGLIEQKEDIINISNLFSDKDIVEKNDGSFKLECPCCGLQGERTRGFILFPDNNRAYCHSSGRNFNMLEAYALKKGIIQCIDGRETGQKKRILNNEQFKETLDALKEEYDDEFCSSIYEVIGLKVDIELPNDGKLISTFANQLSLKTMDKNMFFFRNATAQIVEIGKIKNVDGDIEYTGFVDVKPNRFITLIEKYFRPWSYKYIKNSKLKISKSMPQSIAQTVLVSDYFITKMPILNNILTVPLPIVHHGVLTFPKRGYDERFASWLPYTAPTIDEPDMTLEEGKKIINWLYSEFCFESEQDKTHAIASLLTPFIRGFYERETCRTPLWIQQANRERSGKEYLEGIRSITYEGIFIEDPALSTGDKDNGAEELRKKLTSAFLMGRNKYHSSNNKGHINNATLEASLTKEHYSDRILGINKMGHWPNLMEFSLSGNVGMTMSPDLVNRSRFINLFLDVEDANARIFITPDLHGWVTNNRGKILSALYSLVRNWVKKGMPSSSLPFASYPEWARVCGGIMESAGYNSPCNKEKDMLGISIDPLTADMKELFEICNKEFGNKYVNKAEIKNFIIKSGTDVFTDYNFNDQSGAMKFGKMFNRFVGRIFSNIRLVVYDKTAKTQRWKYGFLKINDKNDNLEETLNLEESDTKIDKIMKIDDKNGHYGHFEQDLLSVGSVVTRAYNKDGVQNTPKVTIVPTSNIQTDRQIQFWEADECKNITSNYTKEEVLKWIKSNPNSTVKQMYDKFKVGSIKFKNELIRDCYIKQNGDKLKCKIN